MTSHHRGRLRCFAILPYIQATALLVAICPVATCAHAKVLDRVCLTTDIPKYDQTKEDGTKNKPVKWVREIFRQAFLTIVRDEFGLPTRDATLGEAVDRDDPDCFHLSVMGWNDDTVAIDLMQGTRSVFNKDVATNVTSGQRTYPRMAANALKLKEELIPVLQDIGLQHYGVQEGQLESLPQEIEVLLLRMNHVSQYAAVRRLHELMKYEGRSPAILGGLARGYANLSQLTVPVLDMRHMAFGARSMVYAVQMSQADSGSAQAHWHRAYAFLLSGFPVVAKAELGRAQKKVTDDVVEPDWVSLIRMSIDHQFIELETVATDEFHPCREIAALLWFRSSRLSISNAFIIQTGQAARDVVPDCQYLTAGLYKTAGVALNHRNSVMSFSLHAESIQKHLADVPTLTDDATILALTDVDVLATNVARAVNELAEADVDEPSLGILAANIQAWHTQQLIQRAWFLSYSLGLSAGDYVEENMSALKDQRFSGLFAMIGLPRIASQSVLSEKSRQIRKAEINYCSIGYTILRRYNWGLPIADGTLGDYLSDAWWCNGNALDCMRKKYKTFKIEDRLQRSEWLTYATTNSPLAFSDRVLYDWAAVRDKAVDWQVTYPGYPGLQWALARSKKVYGDLDEAIGHYDRYLASVDDIHGYIGLAEAWYMKGDDRWTDILKRALECEDHALQHASVGQRAASTLMQQGKFEEALEWAQVAAASYSGWGVASLIDCQTGLGKFEEAEELAMAMSRRYSSNAWYDWCASTGSGDLESAWEFKRQLLARGYAADSPKRQVAEAIHALLKNDNALALETLQKMNGDRANRLSGNDAPWPELMTAVLADRMGNTEVRDEVLEVLSNNSATDSVTVATAKLAQGFQAVIAADQVDMETLATVLEENGNLPVQHVFVGYFLRTHDHTKEAIEMFKVPARLTWGWNRTLAWHWLRELGVDPIHIEERAFTNAFVDRRVELPDEEDGAKSTESESETKSEAELEKQLDDE